MVESHLGRLLLWVALLLLVVLIYARQTSPVSAWRAADWSALADILVALVLLTATIIAVYELHEARELRWEQTRPNVIAWVEADGDDASLTRVVIGNVGGTVAEDVRLAWAAGPPRIPEADPAESPFPEVLGSLVPGQEWRFVWDPDPWGDRELDVQPQMHRVLIRYTDSRSVQHHSESVLYRTPRWRVTLGGANSARPLADHAPLSREGAVRSSSARARR